MPDMANAAAYKRLSVELDTRGMTHFFFQEGEAVPAWVLARFYDRGDGRLTNGRYILESGDILVLAADKTIGILRLDTSHDLNEIPLTRQELEMN